MTFCRSRLFQSLLIAGVLGPGCSLTLSRGGGEGRGSRGDRDDDLDGVDDVDDVDDDDVDGIDPPCDVEGDLSAFVNGDPFVGSTADAANGHGGSCGGDAAPDLIYALTPTTSGPMTLSLANTGTAFDTVLYVQSSCGGLELSCNDDSVGSTSVVDIEAVANTTYYVVVDGFASDAGSFELRITQELRATLDPDTQTESECSDPEDITAFINGPSLFGSTVGTGSEHSGGCGGGGAPDVAYVVRPTTSGTLAVSLAHTGTNYDTVLYAQSACEGGGIEQACNDDSAVGTRSALSFHADAGQTYFVVVDGYGSASGDFELTLTAENDPITVSGVVVNYDGTPMAGALVGAQALGDGRGYPGVIADGSGAFVMELDPSPASGDLVYLAALDPEDPAGRLAFLTMARAAPGGLVDAFPPSLTTNSGGPRIDLSPLTTLASAAFPVWDEQLTPAAAFAEMRAEFVDVALGSELDLATALVSAGTRAVHLFPPPTELTGFASPAPGGLRECLEQAAVRAAGTFRAGNSGSAESHQGPAPESTWGVVGETAGGTITAVSVFIGSFGTRILRASATGDAAELIGTLESGTSCDQQMRIANAANRRAGIANCREFAEFTALHVFDNCRGKGAQQISMVRGNANAVLDGRYWKGHAFTLVSDLPDTAIDLSRVNVASDTGAMFVPGPTADSPPHFLTEDEARHVFVVDGWGLNRTTDPTSRENIEHYVREYPRDYLREFGLDQLGANRRVAMPGSGAHDDACGPHSPVPDPSRASVSEALVERASASVSPTTAGTGETCGSCGRPDVAVTTGGLESCSAPPPPPPPAPSAPCGDGICDRPAGESEQACPQDCPLSCGDGVCNSVEGDSTSASYCPQDCPQVQCCVDTNGCPSEELYSCPGACCCCGAGAHCVEPSGVWVCGI